MLVPFSIISASISIWTLGRRSCFLVVTVSFPAGAAFSCGFKGSFAGSFPAGFRAVSCAISTEGFISGRFLRGKGVRMGSGNSPRLTIEVLNDLWSWRSLLSLGHRFLLLCFVGFSLRSRLCLVELPRDSLVALDHYELSVIRMLHTLNITD